MSDTSQHLSLPFILPSQNQKHVTHNEALVRLDAIVQLSVLSRALGSPPASPGAAARYIVAAGSGAWDGQDGAVAAWQDGAWVFLAPRTGWTAWVEDEQVLLVRQAAGWAPLTTGAASPDTLGINASADSTNRLTVSAPATLLTNEGAGHQLKINKAAGTDTASLLFQTGFSGRAEMGTAGDDGFSIKVSANGAAWSDGLRIAATSGIVSTPARPTFTAATPGSWFEVTTPNTDLMFSTATLNVGGHFNTATSAFTAPVSGVYAFLVNGFLSSNTNGRISFAKNGVTLTDQMQVVVGAAPLSFTAILPLVAGDQVTCRTGTINTMLRYFQSHTAFSGWMVS